MNQSLVWWHSSSDGVAKITCGVGAMTSSLSEFYALASKRGNHSGLSHKGKTCQVEPGSSGRQARKPNQAKPNRASDLNWFAKDLFAEFERFDWFAKDLNQVKSSQVKSSQAKSSQVKSSQVNLLKSSQAKRNHLIGLNG